MTQTMIALDSMLPWDNLPSDEQRRKRITIIMLVMALLLSIIIPFVTVPKEDRATTEAMPERIARVVERKIELPPPPPKPKEEPKKEENAAKKEEVAKTETVKAEPKPVEVQHARAKASKALKEAGLDQLASLRDEFDVPAPAGGGNLITSTEAAGTSRALLTSRAGSGSGALASAGYGGQLSSGFGGGVAGGKGSKGMMGSGKLQSVESNIKGAETASRAVNKDGKSRRSAEDIRKVFDRYGTRLNNPYQRALRDDPNLAGSLTLKLTINPDGSVASCSVASSQLNNAELEAKIVALVKSFDFGADNVEIYNGQYTLNFFSN
jgi:protein TonB